MSEALGTGNSADNRGVTLRLGKLTLTGKSAALALSVILIAIAALIVYTRPSLSNWPLWVYGAGWLAFVIYWGSAAKNAAPSKKSESRESRRVHECLMNVAFLLLFIPIPGLRERYLPAAPLLVPIGLAAQASFFALAVWARRHLGRNWSGQIEIKLDHQLVCSGPYRMLRHPIYSAMIGMFAGTVLVSGKVHALVSVALITFAFCRKIRLEERNLREAFGPAYNEYRRRTWALFPGLF